MGTASRYCLLCQAYTDEPICPEHDVATIDAKTLSFEAPLAEGAIVAERYRIEHQLGQGGFGAVYLATELSLSRSVALKVLHASMSQHPDALSRFYREAKALSGLSHPNVVQVYGFGVDDASRSPWLCMELVPGQTLKAYVEAHGALSETKACALLLKVARALTEVHDKGLVHRDLKPDNIIVRTLSDGTLDLKIVDFGVVRAVSTDSSIATLGGRGVGTPMYMSPEQITQDSVDHRADLYSLGAVLHFVLTARPPFDADEGEGRTRAILHQHVHDEIPPLAETLSDGAQPSAGLVALHAALLQKAPTNRPDTALRVAKALSALSQNQDPEISFAQASLSAISDSEPETRDGPKTPVRTTGPDATVTSPVGAESRALASSTELPKKVLLAIGGLIAAGFIAFSFAGGVPKEQTRQIAPPGPQRALAREAPPVAQTTSEEKTKAEVVPSAEKALPAEVKLQVSSTPMGAEVQLDGTVLGVTPLTASLERDDAEHDLVVERSGHRPHRVRIRLNEDHELRARLVPLIPLKSRR